MLPASLLELPSSEQFPSGKLPVIQHSNHHPQSGPLDLITVIQVYSGCCRAVGSCFLLPCSKAAGKQLVVMVMPPPPLLDIHKTTNTHGVMCRVESSVSDNCCSHVRREEDHRASVTDSFCPPAARSNSCPYGWSSFNSRCFKFIHSAMSWYSAESHCYNLGGHLASVSNPREYSFLQRLTHEAGQTYAWLGGYYLQNRWIWIDGTGLYYTNWYAPSTASSYPCMMLRNLYGWGNTNCGTAYRFICSINPSNC
uniref:C-type lectin domain-containing protein n=1 Tax=Salarias fasciatus TaxID=181472 RepID=A0A672FVW5_SALFA